MIRITNGFKKLVFDDKQMRKDLQSSILEIMNEAIYKFLITMYPKVPVQTGMARASIRPLAEWLSAVLGRSVRVPIARKRKGPWADKRFALGPSLGAQPDGTFGYVHVTGNQYGYTNYWFDWSTAVEHWTYLESQPNSKVASAPWFAMTSGFHAFQNQLHRRIQQGLLPGLKSYVKIATLNLGAN